MDAGPSRGGAMARGGSVGRTLFVVAAWGLGASTALAQQPPPPAPAPPAPPAQPAPTGAELFKQGQELASRGDFVTAVVAFTHALELEPGNWEYKLALADAERQLNQCDKALPRYKELLDTPAADKARVKASLVQCPNAVVIEPPPPELKMPAPPPEPKLI